LNERAAIIDSDEIKKALPEYDRGLGAAAVHDESSDLAKMLQATMLSRGTNVVLPKVGENASSIERLTGLPKGSGYSVHILNMAVSPKTAKRRMCGRYVAAGRIIPPKYLDDVGSLPTSTYGALKAKGIADGFAEINNEGPIGSARATDRSGADFLRGSRYDDGQGERIGARADEGPAGAGRSADRVGPSGNLTAPPPDQATVSVRSEIMAAREALGDDFLSLPFDMEGLGRVTMCELLDDIDADGRGFFPVRRASAERVRTRTIRTDTPRGAGQVPDN
jgi:hypothetical protein